MPKSARIGIPEYAEDMVFMIPKNRAAKRIFPGFHLPKIKKDRARNQYTDTDALKLVEVGMMYTSPPIPANAPEISTPI